MPKKNKQEQRPEQDDLVKIYRVMQYLARGKTTDDINDAMGVPRQKVLPYVRRALNTGMVELGRLPSLLAEDLKQELGSAGRDVDICVIPARGDSDEFYENCGEELIRAIMEVLGEKGECTIAMGGGRTTFRTVRNLPVADSRLANEGKGITVVPATSGVEPRKPLMSSLVVGALLYTAVVPEADRQEPSYQAIISDPYETAKKWDLRGDLKTKVDLLVSSVGHPKHSYCSELLHQEETAIDQRIVGEFLFQPFDRNGCPIKTEEFHVDCAVEEAPSPDHAAEAGPSRTFYSLFSLGELVRADSEAQPSVIVIATDCRRDVPNTDQERSGTDSQVVSKVEAVLGALQGGFIDRLILPMDLAEKLLRELEDRRSQAKQES